MAVSASTYTLTVDALGRGNLDLSSGTFKVMLTTAGYTPNQDAHEFLSDVTNELTGPGYTAGGLTLTNTFWSASGGMGGFYTDPATWPAAEFTGARYAVIFKDTGTAGTSRLISYVDFGGPVSPNGADFVINWVGQPLLNLQALTGW